MLARLRDTFHERGHLNASIIKETAGIPPANTYRNHFGTLRKAYALIGFAADDDCDRIDSAIRWAPMLDKVAQHVAISIERAGQRIDTKRGPDCLLINGKVSVSYRVVRQAVRKNQAIRRFGRSLNERYCLQVGWSE
jgi:hypothetical protein